MRTYEMVLVYDPRVADDEVLSLTGEVRNLLTSKGGVTVTKTDVWGRRRLAYEIADVTEGKYVVVYFAAEPGKAPIGEVERRLQQNDRVLRFLTTRTDEGLKRAGLPIPLEPESEEAVLGVAPASSDDSGDGASESSESSESSDRPARSRPKPAAAEESEPAKKAKKAEEPQPAEEPEPAQPSEEPEPAEEPQEAQPSEEPEPAEEPQEAQPAEEPEPAEVPQEAQPAEVPEPADEPQEAQPSGESSDDASGDDKKEEG